MTTGADWDRVKQLFHEALDESPDARLAFVQARASDAQVLQEVMSLLQAYPSAEGFLSTPADPAQVRAVLARLDTGDELGPFRITGLIGAGGMGEVYRAWDTRLDRNVAIKVVPQASSIDGAARERFEAEARAISRLTHPRISTLYDVGSASIGSATVHYLVMELVDGETLAARLRRGALPVDEALAIAIDIAEALAAAHAAGVVHRDVKPANIMLTRSGAKLLDFGLARLRPSPLAAASARLTAGDPATQRTGLLGTLPYMAPELLRGAGTDARTDLFAFGAVLYEMLTGSAAFAAESEADLVAAILEDEPPPIATRQPLTPPTLAGLVATCLAKDPQDRWQTSHDLVRALRWIRDDRSRPAASTPATGVVSRRVLAWVGVAAAVLMGALAIAAWKRPIVNPSRVTFPPTISASIRPRPSGSRTSHTARSRVSCLRVRSIAAVRHSSAIRVRASPSTPANDPAAVSCTSGARWPSTASMSLARHALSKPSVARNSSACRSPCVISSFRNRASRLSLDVDPSRRVDGGRANSSTRTVMCL